MTYFFQEHADEVVHTLGQAFEVTILVPRPYQLTHANI